MAGQVTVEQGQYWMWMKRRRQMVNLNFQASMDVITTSCWGEKGFTVVDAFGAAAGGGGSIWPPKSYSCSFCKREFRSAQALGGHMNVHRRDRAMLKQSSSPRNGVFQQENHGHEGHGPSSPPLKSDFSAEVCTSADYDLEPKSSCTGINNIVASTLSSPRVSAFCTSDFSTGFHLFGSTPSEAHDSLDSRHRVLKHSRDSTRLNQDSLVESHLRMSLDSIISQQTIRCKRLKTAASASSFSVEPYSSDGNTRQAEVIVSSSSVMEDIDLELRLGEPPKVK